MWDWDKSILGYHSFRQAQTAITSYWFIHEGFAIDYETPVLGKPWAIPFEFPLYQITVALFAQTTAIDLDRAGRATSVFLWLACFFPLERILRWWISQRLVRWAVILTVASCPTYIYWSDSFMIESTALFFSLMYLYGSICQIRQNSVWWAGLALACGLTAGLEKATTFLIVLVPVLAFAGLDLRGHQVDRFFWKKLRRQCVLVALPLVGVALWTAHADALKNMNPLARDFITSHALIKWNFGTVFQRFSLDFWQRILSVETHWGLGRGRPGLMLGELLVLVVAIYKGAHRITIVVMCAAYLTGPLLFANLFYVHEYYNYENGIYLDLALSLAVIDCVGLLGKRLSQREAEPGKEDSANQNNLCCLILIGISICGICNYSANWMPMISRLPSSDTVRQSLQPVARAGNPQDILLVYGLDWNPTVPYYSGRKTIMDNQSRSLESPAIKEALAQLLPDEHIAAMIVSGPLTKDAAFIQERTTRFHLQSKPIDLPWGKCYLRSL